jgi:transcriptional regulator with XRE-family HTH domain
VDNVKWAWHKRADYMVQRPRAEITGAQIRAARGLLNLSIEALATEAKLSLKTIRRAEREHGQVPITVANAERIMSVLEARGACFIAAGNGGAGVRLRSDPPPRWGDFKTMQPKAKKETAKKDRARSTKKPR